MSKRKPESETTTPTTFAPPETKTRKSSKGVFVIQGFVPADDNRPDGWSDIPALPTMESTAACRDYIKRTGIGGKYRVIIVRDTFEATVVNKPVVTFK